MCKRVRSGVDVLVYHPISFETKEVGPVQAAYPLAVLAVGGSTFVLDPFGVGVVVDDLNMESYNQPVYQVPSEFNSIEFSSNVVGTYPVGLECLKLMRIDRGMDLADFILPGEPNTVRLEQWVDFVEEERTCVTDG